MPRAQESASELRASLLAEWEAKRGKKSLGNQSKGAGERKAHPVEPLSPTSYVPSYRQKLNQQKNNVRANVRNIATTEMRSARDIPQPQLKPRYRVAGAAAEGPRIAPPIAEKLPRPPARRKVNRKKQKMMPSWAEWLATEDGAEYRQIAAKSKKQYEDEGGRRKREKEKVIEKQLAPDLNALISDDNPKATKAEKKAKKEEAEKKRKALEHYPPREELLEQWPPPRCGPLLMSGGGMGKPPVPEKWEYPKNEHQMVCAKWKKTGGCLKFEQTGWCPFHHPYDAPPIPMSGKLVCSAVAEENYKIWLEAAKAGDHELLQALITGGPNQPKADVNYVAEPGTKGIPMDLQGKSAANVCARLGHKDCLLLLLQNGASRKKSEHEIHSLLFAAAQKSSNKEKDCEACVQICLENRVSIAEVDEQTGQTVLHSVIDRKHYSIMPYLIHEFEKENAKMTSKGVGVNHLDVNGFSALHVAVAKGSAEAVRILLGAGATPNTQQHPGDNAPCTGNSPLGIACKKGNLAIVQLLLEAKAAVDANAVVYALLLEDQSITALLETANAATKKPKPLILARNKDRSGTVHVACCINKDEQALVALQRVLELGVAAEKQVSELVDSQNTRGVTPLMMASRIKNLATIRHLLVECKANSFAQDCDGNTALHHTEHLMEGSDEVILLVCKKGGGERLPEITNNLGQKPTLPTKMGEGLSKGMEKCSNQ